MIVSVGVLAAFSDTAHAENPLVSSNPAAGSALDVSPTQLTLAFTNPLGVKHTVTVLCNGSTPVAVGEPAVGPDQRTLVIAVPNPLPKGNCQLSWSLSAADGTPDGGGNITFEILNDSAPGAPVTPSTNPTGSTAAAVPVTPGNGASSVDGSSSADRGESPSGGPQGLARLVATIGVAVLFGALAVIAMAWPEGVEYILTVRFLRWAWVVAVAGSYLHVVTLTAYLTGKSVGASLLPTAWTDVIDTAPGISAVLRLVLAGASGWVVVRPERVIDPMTQLAALAMPGLAVATLGFSRSDGPQQLLGFLAGSVHALAMAVWFGGLVLLTRVVLSGPGDEDLVHAVRGYSRISTVAILVTVLSGGVQLFRLDGNQLFDNAHGRIVLFKAVVVAATVFIGTAARQLVRDKLSRADSLGPRMAERLRRALGIEAVATAFVLLLSAWLLSTTPPKVDASVPSDVGTAKVFRSEDGTLEVTLAFTQVVGANAVRVEVLKPATGVSALTFEFVPPAGSTASAVVFSVPTLLGPGAVYLPLVDGMPLDAAGRWTITAKLGGVVVASSTMDVLVAAGASTGGVQSTAVTASSSSTP